MTPTDTAAADAGTATAADRAEVATWLDAHWPHWRAEALRALDKGTLVVAHDHEGISAFCAYDVNRAGTVRSYHATRGGGIAPTPQRILRPLEDPVLGPWVRLWDGKGRREVVAVAELVRMAFGDDAAR